MSDNSSADHKRTIIYCLIAVASIAVLLFAAELFFSSTESGGIVDDDPSANLSLPSVSPHKNDNVMEYIYNAPESDNDVRYDYHWEILKTALEKTKENYGPYIMARAKLMSETRQAFELLNKTGALTVMYLDTKPSLEKNLYPVRIPVDKNLCGYRIMLIRKDDQQKFNAIKTLDDLKKISIGQGNDWTDVDILKSDSFNIVTGSDYEGLFKMLVHKRFDAFSRSAVEILDEYEKRKDELKDLKIEDSLLLYYPLPMYFWFSKTEKGKKLAKRAKEGMEMMISDGTYDKIFLNSHGYKAEKLHLKKRRIFKVDNPFLTPETPFGDKQLWYNPINK